MLISWGMNLPWKKLRTFQGLPTLPRAFILHPHPFPIGPISPLLQVRITVAPLHPAVLFYHLKKQKVGERDRQEEMVGGKAIQSSENVAKQD